MPSPENENQACPPPCLRRDPKGCLPQAGLSDTSPDREIRWQSLRPEYRLHEQMDRFDARVARGEEPPQCGLHTWRGPLRPRGAMPYLSAPAGLGGRLMHDGLFARLVPIEKETAHESNQAESHYEGPDHPTQKGLLTQSAARSAMGPANMVHKSSGNEDRRNFHAVKKLDHVTLCFFRIHKSKALRFSRRKQCACTKKKSPSALPMQIRQA